MFQVNQLIEGSVEEIDGVRKEHLLIEDDSSHWGSLDTATKRSFLGKGVILLTDIEMTPELVIEGLSRELQSRIQARRKELNLSVTDRVTVTVRSRALEFGEVVKAHGEYLKDEVQADALAFVEGDASELVIEGCAVDLVVAKV